MLGNFRRIISVKNFKHHSESGQVATLLILVMVVVLIFIMATVNIGKVANTTTALSNAADSSVLNLASQLASKANYLYKTLGSTKECRYYTGFLGKVLGILPFVESALSGRPATWGNYGKAFLDSLVFWVEIIVAAIVFWPLIILVVLANMYNKYSETQDLRATFSQAAKALTGLTKRDYYRETAILSALGHGVTDPREVVDTNDVDSDGNTKEKVPYFETWWAARVEALKKLAKAFKTPVKEFLTPLVQFKDYLEEKIINKGGLFSRQEIEGKDGALLELLRPLSERNYKITFWKPGDLQGWYNTCGQCVKDCATETEGIRVAGEGDEEEGCDWELTECKQSDKCKKCLKEAKTCEECKQDGKCSCCDTDVAYCSQCEQLPESYDEVDAAVDSLKDFVSISNDILKQKESDFDELVSNWEDWVTFYYDPDPEVKSDYYDQFDMLLSGAGEFKGLADFQGVKEWLGQIKDIRDNQLPLCQCAGECSNGNILNYPCRDGISKGVSFDTVDNDVDDEFQPVIEQIENEFIPKVEEFRGDSQNLYNQLQEISMVTNQGRDPETGEYITELKDGVNPVKYKWPDMSCPKDENGARTACRSIMVKVSKFKIPKLDSSTSGNWFTGGQQCMELVGYKDPYARKTWVRITMEEPANKQMGIMGKWNPYDNDDPDNPCDCVGDGKFSITRTAYARYYLKHHRFYIELANPYDPSSPAYDPEHPVEDAYPELEDCQPCQR